MGIDVYLLWDGQTKQEKEAQYTGWSTVHGHVGYLREAYHGAPYATEVLFPADWRKQPEGGFVFTSQELAERLPDTLCTVVARAKSVYQEDLNEHSPEVQAFADFVLLHKQLEASGKHPRIYISS